MRRFEVGGQFTDLILGTPGEIDVPKFALGPGFALNLNRHLALDASYSVMSVPACLSSFYPCSGGRKSLFIAGARAEARGNRYGVFAYGRPGVLHTNAWTETQPYYYSTITVSSPGSSLFVSDVGGGVEYFASSRVHAKVELGDLLMYQGCAECYHWTNHLQFSTGVYTLIGKPLAGKPFDTSNERSHRFFDKTNLTFLTISLLGQASDAITTQRFISHGKGPDADPLARPFVSHGWGGQVSLAALDNAAQLSVMFALHRMHQHRIERAVPLIFGAASGIEGYHNDRRE